MPLSAAALAAALACDADVPPPSQDAVDRVTAVMAAIRRRRTEEGQGR